MSLFLKMLVGPRLPAGIRNVLSYINDRFPLHTNGAFVILSFVCQYLLYGKAYGEQIFTWRTVLGAATFLLLFIQLRLVDDLDDLRSDSVQRNMSSVATHALRNGLVKGVMLITVSIVVMNRDLTALMASLAASVGIVFTPFVLKRTINELLANRIITRSLKNGILAIFYEGTHFTMILYVYFLWSSATHESLHPFGVIAVTGTFWTTFEFWKFSRFVTQAGWQAYELSWNNARILLIIILALSFVFQVAAGFTSKLPHAYFLYTGVITILFVRWLLSVPPASDGHCMKSSFRSFLGILFVVAVNIGVLLAVLMAGVSHAVSKIESEELLHFSAGIQLLSWY